MPLLLGFDFGTSYLKVGLFDPAGALHGLGRVAVALDVAEDERRELSTRTFWRLAGEALDEALRQANARAADIVGVSYSSQANTFLLLDESGAELTPLIVWNDRRAEVLPADAAFSGTESFQRAVGFRGVERESAVTKCRWWQKERGSEWRRAHRLMTLPDYFTWTMTGVNAGDASTAALLGLYHLHESQWWPTAVQHFGLGELRLPMTQAPGTACGVTTADATKRLGLRAGIPFAVGALDHHAAAIGAGVGTFADASLSTGTVIAAVCLVAEVEPIAGCFHGRHGVGARYYRLAFDPRGAGELEAFQRQHASGRSLDQLVAAALDDPPTAPARNEAEAFERRTVRAIVERVAGAQRDLLRAILPAHHPVRAVAATGGGARSAAWLQLTARVLGVPVVTAASAEGACLGAAIFAAAAGKTHSDIASAAGAMTRAERVFR